MAATISPLFTEDEVEPVRTALHDASGAAVAELEASLHAALAGSPQATRDYVDAYRRLTLELLEEAGERGHELSVEALVSAAAEAPFSAWSAVYDTDGVALDLVNRIRPWLGRASLPTPPVAANRTGVIDPAAGTRFLRRVRAYLNQLDHDPLLRLMGAWDLTLTELGGLFGVRRQAVAQWLQRGTVPADRQDKLVTLLAVTDLLERKLKADRLPGVARRPAAAYGGESMLDLIRADRHRELLDTVRASFDWAAAA